MTYIESYANRLLGLARCEPGDALVIDPYSCGDVFQTLTLMGHFRREHRIQRINFLCLNRAARTVSFFNNIDVLLTCGSIDEEKLAMLSQTRWYKNQNRIFIAPPSMHMDDVNNIERLDGTILMRLKKQILGIPEYALPELPTVQKKQAQVAYESALRQGLKPQSVIIFNHANTMKSMNPEVFKSLLDVFPGGVFFDKWSGAPVGWGKLLEIPLEQIPYFCDYSGNCICIRSGITELLSLSTSTIHTIYPGSRWMADWFPDKITTSEMFRTWGIRELGLNPNSQEKKIFIEDCDNDFVIASKILESVQN